LKERHFSS